MSVEAAPSPVPAAGRPSKVVLVLLVLNLGASGFSTYTLLTAKPTAATPSHDAAEPSGQDVSGPIIALEPFVVNLDEPGTSRYLKATFQLELVAHDVAGAIEKNKQVIRDAILSHLSGLRLADTLGSAAKDKLRGELLQRLTGIIGEHKVRRVFFQEFVVQ